MKFDAQVDISEVNRMLRQLPASVQKKPLNAALRFAVRPLVKAMRNNALSMFPDSSGSLAKAVGARSINLGLGPNSVAINVRPQRTNTRAWLMYMGHYGKAVTRAAAQNRGINHAHLMEFGFTLRNKRQYAAKPFIRNAWTATKAQIPERFRRNLKVQVDKELKKIRAANKR